MLAGIAAPLPLFHKGAHGKDGHQQCGQQQEYSLECLVRQHII